jgi:hypothetical protein
VLASHRGLWWGGDRAAVAAVGAESCASEFCGEPVVVVSNGVWLEAPAGAADLVDHGGVAFCLDASKPVP